VEDQPVTAIQRPSLPRVPSLVSGRWYGPDPGTLATNAAVAASTLYAYPALVPFQCTVQALALRVGTQAVGTGKMGIYRDAGGVPGALVAEVAADVDLNVAPANLTATFAANPTLAPGWYWFASCFSAATAVPVTYSSAATLGTLGLFVGHSLPSGVLANGTTSATSRITRTAALTYVAATAFFPASFGAITYGTNTPGSPVIAYQIA
jgi:hypothetical protein